ncbi:hypothetical protein JAAARDRAFT_51921, partial [Jaapia argillacea MUCL 33604]
IQKGAWCSGVYKHFCEPTIERKGEKVMDKFMCQNNIDIPSPSTISHNVREMFLLLKSQVAEILQSHFGKLHLAVDGWTSPNVISFLGVVVHLLCNGVMHRFILDFIKMTKAHTGAILSQFARLWKASATAIEDQCDEQTLAELDEAEDEEDIEAREDVDEDCKEASDACILEELGDEVELETLQLRQLTCNQVNLGCFSIHKNLLLTHELIHHFLTLAFNGWFAEMLVDTGTPCTLLNVYVEGEELRMRGKDGCFSIHKITNLSKKVFHSPTNCEWLLSLCRDNNLPEQVLLRPVATRWNTVTEMLGWAIPMREVLDQPYGEWGLLKELYPLLELFLFATKEISEAGTPLIHQWLEAWIDTAIELVWDEWESNYKPCSPTPSSSTPVQLLQQNSNSQRYFGDIHQSVVDSSHDLLEDYLATPNLPLVDNPISFWLSQIPEKNPLAAMALDFLTVPAASTDIERAFSSGG